MGQKTTQRIETERLIAETLESGYALTSNDFVIAATMKGLAPTTGRNIAGEFTWPNKYPRNIQGVPVRVNKHRHTFIFTDARLDLKNDTDYDQVYSEAK